MKVGIRSDGGSPSPAVGRLLPRDRRWPGRLLNAALLAVSVLVSILLVEGVLHLVRFSHPAFYSLDNRIGGVLRPGARGYWTKEGSAWISINGHGQRDREHAYEKPPGTYRIAVLGDSYAEALQLPIEEAFWSVMATRLDRSAAVGGRRVEAINFGVSGHGTAQELEMLRSRAWAFDPDLVLLAFFAGNDVRNNSRALEGDPLRPYYTLGPDGSLVLDDTFRERIGTEPPDRRRTRERAEYALSDRFLVVQLWRSLKARLAETPEGRARAKEAARRRGVTADGFELGIDRLVFGPPPDPTWRDAWAVTEALVARMGREVRARGKRFMVVTLTHGSQVHPDPRVRAAAAAAAGSADLEYPDRRIAALCAREGIPVLTLSGPFRAHAERSGTVLHGFGKGLGSGHWNREGHRFGGERMAESVSRLLSAPPTAPGQDR